MTRSALKSRSKSLWEALYKWGSTPVAIKEVTTALSLTNILTPSARILVVVVILNFPSSSLSRHLQALSRHRKTKKENQGRRFITEELKCLMLPPWRRIDFSCCPPGFPGIRRTPLFPKPLSGRRYRRPLCPDTGEKPRCCL